MKQGISMLGDGLNDIRSNHLKHIYEKMEALTIKVNSRPSWLVATIVTLLASTLFSIITGLIMKQMYGG